MIFFRVAEKLDFSETFINKKSKYHLYPSKRGVIMDDEDYEIISQKDIGKLKDEIKELREGKTSDSANNVIKRLDEMIEIFKTASASLKDESPINERIDEISQKLETLLDQNQKIAEGILAIADLINEKNPEIKPMQR